MRQYISLFILSAASASMLAIPADPSPKEVVQPDGSVITLFIRGDEYGHALYNVSGERIVFNKETSFFEKAPDNMPQQRFLKKSPSRILMRNDFPAIGKQKSLVVLMEFDDVHFSSVDNPHEFYDRMLNEEGFSYSNGANGSARDFYLKSSDGLFDPTFVVAGPVRLSREATYYGEDNGTQDCHMGEAIKEALDQLDDEIDFSDYDTNGDGLVDNIFFFYAGNGQADTPDGNNLIWPHSAFMEEAWEMHLEYDGKTIGNYACSNEIRYSSTGKTEPSGIGTFVHEFGHVLGLADHYDTGYNLMAFGLGAWDTMAQGSYNNNMHTPPLFSMFEKTELGWADYTDFTADSHPGITDLKWIGDKSEGLRVSVPGNDNEWFILENRQKKGWDEYLPGHGLLIWHIDMDEQVWLTNKVNVDPTHQRIDIVEVDGIGSDRTRDGDVMPGSANITSYNLAAWDGTVVLSLDDVAENSDGIISVLPKGNSFSLAKPAVTATDVRDEQFSFSWQPCENASSYFVSVRLDGACLDDYDGIICDAAGEMTVTGLSPESEYTVEVVAGRGSYRSEPALLNVATAELNFEKRKMNSPEVCVSGDEMTIDYTPLKGASDHVLCLTKITREESTSEMGYDFTQQADGMPELWSSSSVSFNSINGYFGESAPSLRLSKDDSYLVVAWPETLIDRISFWQRAKGNGGDIVVEVPSAEDWSEVSTVTVTESGETVSIDIPEAEAVRLRYVRTGGYIVIDDVKAQGRSLSRIPVEGLEQANMGMDGHYVVKGLKEGMYGVTIYGIQDSLKSIFSDEVIATVGNSSIKDISSQDAVPVMYYNALGLRSSRPFPGLNIVEYSDGSRRKVLH